MQNWNTDLQKLGKSIFHILEMGLCTKDVHPNGGRGGFEIVDENGHGGRGGSDRMDVHISGFFKI